MLMDEIKLQVKEYCMRTVPFKIDDFSVFFDIYTTPITMRLEDMKMHAVPPFTVKINLTAKHPAYDNIGVNIIQLYDDRLRGDGCFNWFIDAIRREIDKGLVRLCQDINNFITEDEEE